MTAHSYTGIWPVAPTPFTDTGDVDYYSMRNVLDCMIDQGVDGICILANFSEQFLISDEERQALMRLSLEHVAGRVPVIVTISHFATKIAVERAEQSHRCGGSDDDATLSWCLAKRYASPRHSSRLPKYLK